MKYLDFSIEAQEYLKPTFSIMSVNEIIKLDSGTIFNQTSINTHDGDETINIGFGTWIKKWHKFSLNLSLWLYDFTLIFLLYSIFIGGLKPM